MDHSTISSRLVRELSQNDIYMTQRLYYLVKQPATSCNTPLSRLQDYKIAIAPVSLGRLVSSFAAQWIIHPRLSVKAKNKFTARQAMENQNRIPQMPTFKVKTKSADYELLQQTYETKMILNVILVVRLVMYSIEYFFYIEK